VAILFDQTDLERRRLERRCEQLSDDDLVELIVRLLSGNPPVNAASKTASHLTRIAFFDVARRWIPADVVGEAFRRLELEDEEAD
jgi:hypothetical protein